MKETNITTTSEPLRSSPKLGEELPVFCERCGYSLHGLAQMRCEHCTLLQFHCPECGHHQPINTLRPAAQTIPGRIRGGWLALVILFKLNLIGWLLFAWVGMGANWAYEFESYSTTVNGAIRYQTRVKTARLQRDAIIAFVLLALPFGTVLRMALLRWKRGWGVGLVLASMVMGAIALGAWIRGQEQFAPFPSAYSRDFILLMTITFVTIVFGATVAWPIWTLLVHAFLPKRTAYVLLNWQQSLSNPVSALAR
jgi:hypothetical protein